MRMTFACWLAVACFWFAMVAGQKIPPVYGSDELLRQPADSADFLVGARHGLHVKP